MKKLIAIFLSLTVTNVSFAQIQFWSDTFEDVNAPSSGSRTPSVEFSCGSPSSYFFRTPPGVIALQSGTYSNFEGSKVWAGEDIDLGPSCTSNSISPNQQVTWSGINISGKTGLSFSGLFAANGLNGGWEGSNFAPNQDFMAVEYRIDGGAWTRIIAFYAGAVTSTSALSLDADPGDASLVGNGTSTLSYTFTQYSASIPGTGTTLDLRFNCSSNGTAAEEFAVDNFRLFYTSALPVRLRDFSVRAVTGKNMLTWVTTSEQNNQLFEIEQSQNGTNFTKIGSVEGVGNSVTDQQYSFTDHAPYDVTLYRLKQIDWDGNFEYSATVTVKNLQQQEINIYPNPFVGNTVTVVSKLLSASGARIVLTDIHGAHMPAGFSGTGTSRTGDLSRLKKGTYILRVYSGGKVYARKVCKR